MDAEPRDSSQTCPNHNTKNPDAASIAKIKSLLQANDDTQRFVGLALLKSVLDNTPELRQDATAIQDLWASVSPRFLDRLIKTGSGQSRGGNVKEMLDLAVSVIHIFAALVPETLRAEDKFTGRIPGLARAVLYSSGPTTDLLLKLLHALVSTPEGAKAFVEAGDVSSLAEIAPTHAAVLDILLFAWLNAMASVVERHVLINQVADTIKSLVASFTGTDGVTLLEFIATFLRQVNPAIYPHDPQWLKTVVKFIQNLVTSRPNAAARSAYTNAAAALLQAYPARASKLLFTEIVKDDDKPFAYLLINLLLIDIRSSIPTLLQQLNQPDYAQCSTRLASAFDVISIFIGHLVRCLEDDSMETFTMSPDSLLKLRKGISETLSVTVEYLRDRWDATFAGAMGLHPDARTSNTETWTGSHPTLAWDSLAHSADDDPLILSAVRALALWLREDDNETLRQEATGLTDMLMELYQGSSSSDKLLDFRSPTLVGLEALLTTQEGRDLFLRHDGWTILSKDLVNLLATTATTMTTTPSARISPGADDPSRGIEIVRALLTIAEHESSSGTPEEWMDIITAVAAWDAGGYLSAQQSLSPSTLSAAAAEFAVSVLQLCCTLLAGASPGMRNRYRQSMSAVNGVIEQLRCRGVPGDDANLIEAMDDVKSTMDHVLQGL
ncbi:hypothetical protein E4U21_005299 [Claviceps maximensis]|nr:hypothetical protein E4U21_005299 [Claviceps maximensis]